jgi:mRNA interferase HigB
VHVISRKALSDFVAGHPDAAEPMDRWYRITKKAKWNSVNDVRKDFPHADAVAYCTVFNIAGNKYRLITKIKYERQIVYIRQTMTHKEYDRGMWQNDCNSR